MTFWVTDPRECAKSTQVLLDVSLTPSLKDDIHLLRYYSVHTPSRKWYPRWYLATWSDMIFFHRIFSHDAYCGLRFLLAVAPISA